MNSQFAKCVALLAEKPRSKSELAVLIGCEPSTITDYLRALAAENLVEPCGMMTFLGRRMQGYRFLPTKPDPVAWIAPNDQRVAVYVKRRASLLPEPISDPLERPRIADRPRPDTYPYPEAARIAGTPERTERNEQSTEPQKANRRFGRIYNPHQRRWTTVAPSEHAFEIRAPGNGEGETPQDDHA